MTTREKLQLFSQQLALLADVKKIGLRQFLIHAIALMPLCLVAVTASAAVTTYNVSFSANSFQVGSGGNPPPVDPVIGDLTVTLDPAVAVMNQTAGITLNSLNIALGSAISFSYDPAAGVFPAGTLRVGGVNNGSDAIIFNPSTDDFWLYINDLTGTPAFQQTGYTQTSVSNNNLYYTLNQTGTVNVSVVPEPASITVFSLGLALAWFGLLARRPNKC